MSALRLSGNDRRVMAGVFVLAALGVGVYHAFILTPLARATAAVGAQARDAKTKVRQIEELLAQEVRLREEHERLSDSVQRFQTSLPPAEAMPSVIRTISDLAVQSGVKLQMIFPQRGLEAGVSTPSPATAAKSSPLYEAIPIRIEAIGGYHQLGALVSRLESHPQPMHVKSLRVTAHQNETRRHLIKLVLLAHLSTTAPANAETTDAKNAAAASTR